MYVSPRPPAVDFFRYYKESQSARYFGTTFYRATAEARREKLWHPKAVRISQILNQQSATNHQLIDIGGGHGIFAEEYSKIAKKEAIIIEPGPDTAQVCREKGFQVIESFLETVSAADLPFGPKTFVSFELFEHLHSPRLFLESLRKLMQPDDMFIFTTLSGMGIDIQALWENSNSISLQHLNFFNPKSIRILLNTFDLKPVLVETPGKLDLDILFKNKEFIKDRFWYNLISHASPDQHKQWQAFISKQGFSSHMFVVARRL